MKKISKLMMAVMLTAFSTTAFAEMDVPANLQVALFYKIFDFDQNLTQSAGNEIVIGIFYDPNNLQSSQANEEIKDNFSKLSDKKIGDKNVIIKEITSINQLHDINIVYVTPGVDTPIGEIAGRCNTNKILGISGVEQYAQQGLAIAIDLNDQKPRIIINKTSAESSGAKLSSKIMALAKII